MIVLAIALDIFFLGVNSYCAVVNRGTFLGWVFTILVIWRCVTAISIFANE